LTRAVEAASTLKPQVIVMDLHMSDEDDVTPQEVKSRLLHFNQTKTTRQQRTATILC
jgi:CheY-like chemotaxis protein